MATLVRLIVFVAALNLQAQAAPADSVDIQIGVQARQLFNTIMSPYCPGSLLSGCPSSQAAVLRDSIRARLQRGQSPDEVRQALVAIYGNEILASPPFEGLGTLTWMGVAVIFLGGFAAAAGWMRHRRREPAATADIPRVEPGDLQRLQRELDEQDRN
ncbi:MAG: cytochrome c-type biogenesis protein CcmH [bacterium]|nr:cytochrome c-type biogenesis protein CcmH [bacterium]